MSGWQLIDESWGVGERLELGEVLVVWVDPARTRPGDPDPTCEWTGKSTWAVGHEDGLYPCEPIRDGWAATREEARRDALAAAYGLLEAASEDVRALGPTIGARP